MSNVVQLRKTRRVMGTFHQVTFDLVPREVLKAVFEAAIPVAWMADDGEFTADNPEAIDHMEALQKAVNAAAMYTVPIEREVEEPIA